MHLDVLALVVVVGSILNLVTQSHTSLAILPVGLPYVVQAVPHDNI
jgi:hypothetical protein